MITLTYEDVIAKAEEFIKFGKDIHFLVKGYLAEDIVFYLDGYYTQFMEYGDEDEYIIDEYDNDKMYWVDIAPKEGLYYVQEAVYEPQGILAQNDEYDVVYYQKNNILSKENEKRVLGNIFEFTYDEDVEDECETIDEEYYELNDSLKGDWTVETLEDCNCNECLAEKIEHLYAIIDELDKRVEELELKSEGKKDKSASDVDALETMELLLDYLAEYC